MKYLLIIIFSIAIVSAKAQFTGTDSLRNYNNRYITTNPATAFTNNRLNTLLRGIIDFIDTARAGGSGAIQLGIDTVFAVNDSTIRYRKNGVFRQFTLKGVYDSRRKVDTIYKSNDTTLTFTVNGNIRTVIIPGGTNLNLATANQTATGNRTHNWDNHWLYLNNIKSFGIYQDQPDANHANNNFKTQITTDSSIDGTPLQLMWGLRNIDDDIIDSVHFELTSKDSSTYLHHWGADTAKSVKLSLNGNAPTTDIRMDIASSSKTSAYKFGHVTSIEPADSIRLKLQSTSATTKIIGARAESSGIWTPVVIDIPTSGVTALNNIGTGYALVATPGGNIKRINNGYGILIDSTTTANTITIQGDTSSTNHLVTQSDLNDAIAGVSSGINQLTGDVTAGPGTGSQAATIATNAVSNSKFRQSVANSVVGRASNSTGSVADIQAATNSTYLQYNGTNLVFDSLDYAHLKNKPDLQNPGVYFAPAQSFDPTFVVYASAIVAPTNSFSHGTTITWGILDQASGHNSSFYDSAYGDAGTQRLVIRYPNVKNVLNSKLLPDESFAEQIVSIGASVGFTTLSAPVYQWRTMGIRLSGAGTSTWTKNSTQASSWDVTTYNTGDGTTSFNVTATGIDYDQIAINYNGPNGYHIRRYYSGLGAYNAKFALLDALGNPVTSNPTTADEVTITGAGLKAQQIGMATYSASQNSWMGTFTNWWVDGTFECWLVAAPTSTTSTLVRWQVVYPSATNYKIYRSTTLYGTRTLIHTGTEGSYTDSGLSPATKYYYHMVAVVGGVDTYVTSFTTNTK